MSYLPLAHIAERMLSIYLPIATAGHVHFCPVPTELIGVVGAAKPTGFFGVPRVWEKVRAGIQALLTMEQDESKREAVARAMDTGRRYVESRQFGHSRAARRWTRSSPGPTRRCWRRSGRCSASARRRRCSARRRRCRRT